MQSDRILGHALDRRVDHDDGQVLRLLLRRADTNIFVVFLGAGSGISPTRPRHPPSPAVRYQSIS